MTFQEALEFLGIPEYGERIFHCHSKGELYFLRDYIELAEAMKEFGDDPSWFPKWFDSVVKWAEQTQSHPDYVFQHLPELLRMGK